MKEERYIHNKNEPLIINNQDFSKKEKINNSYKIRQKKESYKINKNEFFKLSAMNLCFFLLF